MAIPKNIPVPATKPQVVMPTSGGVISPAATGADDGSSDSSADSGPVTVTIPPELVDPLEQLIATLDPSDPLQQLIDLIDAAKNPDAAEPDPLAGMGAKMDSLRGPV